MSTSKKVQRIRFTLVVDGRERLWEFLRQDKIDSLLVDESITLGQWLRQLRDAEPGVPPAPDSHKGRLH